MSQGKIKILQLSSAPCHNEVRLYSVIGYVTPLTKLLGKEHEIFTSRDQKLEAAREKRRERRQQPAA